MHKILTRAGMPRLSETDLATRRALRAGIKCYERAGPGQFSMPAGKSARRR